MGDAKAARAYDSDTVGFERQDVVEDSPFPDNVPPRVCDEMLCVYERMDG